MSNLGHYNHCPAITLSAAAAASRDRGRVSMSDDHVLANRASWDADAAAWVDRGRRDWAREEIGWGVWHVPESELRLLPDVDGLDVVELGCGTAYVSAWLARRGARPVGLDNSGRQLTTALSMQREFGSRFPLVHGDAERAPLRDASFDLAISEYGAAIWCDPYRWIPEAARLLRPGGQLIFLGHSYIAMLTFPEADLPAGEVLLRPHFGMHRFVWPESDGAVEFAIPHGEMIRLLDTSPPIVALVCKSLANMDGSARLLDPTIDVVSTFRDFVPCLLEAPRQARRLHRGGREGRARSVHQWLASPLPGRDHPREGCHGEAPARPLSRRRHATSLRRFPARGLPVTLRVR
jgi:SAM-dependent methyltransferase